MAIDPILLTTDRPLLTLPKTVCLPKKEKSMGTINYIFFIYMNVKPDFH